MGSARLRADQIGYSRSLLEAEKEATLLNVVRLRYADVPVFLDTTQVIAGYQLQRGMTGGYQIFPNTALNNVLNGGATLQVQENPTFTFAPVTGESFATSFIRPLSPTTLLSLSLGGLPVDILFRLGVQSINTLNNSRALASETQGGSSDFFLLLHDLRALQIAQLIDLRLSDPPKDPVKKPAGIAGAPSPEHIHLFFVATQDRQLQLLVKETKRLLGLSPDVDEVEIVYGLQPSTPTQVAILTRSMLGVLGQLAFSIEVPADDVSRGRTLATVGATGIERQPSVTIHAGKAAPDDAFAAAAYHGTWFWIADEDFNSKLAFTVIQILFELAKVSHAPGTIITIPAG